MPGFSRGAAVRSARCHNAGSLSEVNPEAGPVGGGFEAADRAAAGVGAVRRRSVPRAAGWIRRGKGNEA